MECPSRGFEDYAALEEGSAREFIDADMLTSRTYISASFRLCRLIRPDKSVFELYDEGKNRHLLSAKKAGDRYFISSYRACEFAHSSAVVLKAPETPVCYKLYLCVGEQVINTPMLEIWPSSSRCINQDVRKLRVNVPAPQAAVPRHYAHDYSKLVSAAPPTPPGHVRLKNKNPVYKNGHYGLKFARGRAKLSSSKNFLVYREDVLDQQEPIAEDAVFQLGKMGKQTFALDFRHPLSPIQAFAIALAAFDFKHHRASS